MLNAILFARSSTISVEVLENDLWSQHHVYWHRPLELRKGRLFNVTLQRWQRAIHCAGAEKFWRPQHAEMLQKYPHAEVNYLWFLRMLEMGLKLSCNDAKCLLNSWPHLLLDLKRFQNDLETIST